jgi:hypothetical protein
VRAAGPAEFLDREIRIAGIEQQGVDLGRDAEGLLDRCLTLDVNDLNNPDPGQRATEVRVGAAGEGVDELNRAGAATMVLRDDRVGSGERGQEERAHGRRDGRGDFRNPALIGNYPAPLGMAETRPRASAPCSTASCASATVWMQQILMRGVRP